MSTPRQHAVPRYKLFAAFFAVYFLWGSTYLFIHFALETLPPFLLAAARFLIAGALLYAWSRSRGAPPPTLIQWRAGFITGGLFFLCGNGAVVWSQQHVPSGIAALLVAIVPLFVVLLEWLRPPHRHPPNKVLAGVLIGLAGLVLLVGLDALRGSGTVDPLAALILTGGSLAWAFGTLYAQRASLPKSGLLTASMQLLSGGALLGLASLTFGEPFRVDWSDVSTASILSVGYLILFGSILGFTAFSWLVRVAPLPRVATYAYVNPVVAMFLGWLFAEEKLSMRTLIASGVVLAGVALITAGTGETAVSRRDR